MNQLTLMDKIQVLFSMLVSSPIVIGIFAFSLLLMIILIFSSRLNKKLVKYGFIGIYLAVIGFSIFKYGGYFLTSIDSFLTLFMANIYFPIIPIYVAIMIISFIIMIITLSGKRKSRVIKLVNVIFFTLIQMLFVVFIYTVESNNIDLSSNATLYSNDQTMTLLELGMGLFVVWVILLIVIIYLKKADKIFKSKKKEETDDFDEYINDYNIPVNPVPVVNKNIDMVPNVNMEIPDMSAPVENSENDIVKSLVPDLVSVKKEDVLDFDDTPSVPVKEDVPVQVSSFDSATGLVTFDKLPEIEPISAPYHAASNNVNISAVADVKTPTVDTSVSTNTFIKNIPNGVTEVDNSISSSNTFVNNAPSEPKKVEKPTSDIFSSFQFLDMPSKPVERRNDDVEIIDL